MKSPESDLLTFIDLLDLDEEVIDRRLMPLMVRKTFSTKHLTNAIYLIKYKLLINDQEGTECDNNDERLYDQFMVNLLAELDDDNIGYICEITNLLLNMFPSNLASKSEHLLQQILTNERCIDTTRKESIEKETDSKILLKLKVCDSILKAVIKSGAKISLLFFETQLEEILDSSSDHLKNHFLMTTVPLLFEGLVGYNILDRIWNYCQKLNSEQNYTALKVLSCLSGYFLPVADKNGQMKYESELIFQTKFWDIILLGMSSSDSSNRRVSLYLAKRSIDCIVTMRRSTIVSNETGNIIFSWDTNKETEYKNIWDSYFVLMESLEEKQSNIVLPSLQLFEVVKKIGREWLNCAFAIGLKHDNAQVKQKCIEYRIETKIQTEPEAQMLLEALNDISLFDKQEDIKLNLNHLKLLCSDINYFLNMLKTIPSVNWSPVPLYYLSLLIGKKIIIDKNLLHLKIGSLGISSILCDILKTPCNNVIIRRAAQRNFISFFVLNCKDIDSKDMFTILSSLQIDIFNGDTQVKEMKYSLSSYVNDYVTDNKLFYELIVTSYTNIELILEYIQNKQCINEYYAEIKAKIAKVDSVASRQYSKKSECKNEFVYLTSLYGDIKHILKMHGHTSEIPGIIYEIMKKEIKPLFQYIISLLLDDSMLNDDMNFYVQSCNNLFYYAGSHPFDDENFHHLNCNGVFYSEFGDEDVQEIILQINSMCLAILTNNRGDLQSKVFAQNILKILLCNNVLNTNNCKEIIKITNFVKMANGIENQKEKENKGRLQNKFYETSCEILDELTRNKREVYLNISEILSFIDKVIECGGYGCLKWILKVMNKMLPVIDENNIKYDIKQFIHRMWRETEELKSNSQYAVCIEEFIDLITHDFLLKTSKYNNLILHYSKSIIEYGSVSITPLIFLVQSIGKKDITSELGQIVYILQEILLFAPVLRKDQRILENTLQHIEKEIEEFKKVHFKDWTKDDSKIHHCFSYTVQHLAVATLLKIKDPEIFKTIVDLMMKRIDELFKNKQRYHANSHHHRVLLSALQHMLFILLLQPKSVDLKKTTEWCLELLAKLPHQPTVRMYLEWYIALYYCGKEPDLKKETLENKKFTNLPLLSQLLILYHVMRYRLSEGCNRGEFEFVLDFLLSHTMGSMFNIRLHAQYLALQLYYKGENTIKSKYHLIKDIIQHNFEACSQEKNYIKLKEDFSINTFNVSSCLVPFCIYYFLPCLYEYSSNASELLPTAEECVKYIEENSCYITPNYPACYEKSWKLDYLDKVKHAKSEVNEMLESSGTIQKKYIPWRNMSDIDVYESSKKQENRSDLIVVASLIDKLPNLGGMARTSEVFGVKTYVVDSLRHLQDKQFQGLSVSAERWVDIEEVRPGKPLKDYLMTKKAEGYSIVAAEQTSNSVPLQGFKFPKKTLLLLGHEKEGVPCDLLPLMDSCVEIPQQGFVRSLNVHVTAAIFVWEYSRQNIL